MKYIKNGIVEFLPLKLSRKKFYKSLSGTQFQKYVLFLMDYFQSEYDFYSKLNENESKFKSNPNQNQIKIPKFCSKIEERLDEDLIEIRNLVISILSGTVGGNARNNMRYPTREPIREPIREPTTKSNKNKIKSNKIKNISDDTIRNINTIISYLNEKTNKRFRSETQSYQKLIDDKLKDGYSIEDFKIVIDKKCKEWIGTEFETYLRPETLFGNKFDSYLNASEIKRKTIIDGVEIDVNKNSDILDLF